MSVSRRASFAAGIAAVRRDNNRRRQQQQGGQQQQQQQPGRYDTTQTITVVAGAAALQQQLQPGSHSCTPVVSPTSKTPIVLTPPKETAITDPLTVALDPDPKKAKKKKKGKSDDQDPIEEIDDAMSTSLDMTRPATAFATMANVAKAAAAARKPRIQYEVRPFTRESLEKINIRTSNLIRDYGFLPKRSPNLQDGAQLPAKYEPFPTELLGKPVEELDQYVYEKVGLPNGYECFCNSTVA